MSIHQSKPQRFCTDPKSNQTEQTSGRDLIRNVPKRTSSAAFHPNVRVDFKPRLKSPEESRTLYRVQKGFLFLLTNSNWEFVQIRGEHWGIQLRAGKYLSPSTTMTQNSAKTKTEWLQDKWWNVLESSWAWLSITDYLYKDLSLLVQCSSSNLSS